MRRSVALASLSRDHHEALVLAHHALIARALCNHVAIRHHVQALGGANEPTLDGAAEPTLDAQPEEEPA